MALFWLNVDGKKTPCFVRVGQEDVESLEDLEVGSHNKEEFIAALSSATFSHNELLTLTIKVGAALPSDARKADKKDLAKNIYNKITGKPSVTSTTSKKKKSKKQVSSSDSESSSEEEKKKKNKKKDKKSKVDPLTERFDELALEGQSVTSASVSHQTLSSSDD